MSQLEREIEQVFRRDSGRLISVLTRIFGPHNLELAEDVVQESFVRAMTVWSEDGVPENPGAWLMTTARNRAIDAIRRERTRRTFADDLTTYLDSTWTLASTVDDEYADDWARDDQLRMIFMCCDADVAAENRITLILKTLCGLSVPAIARALLTTESTVNKRLYRTRRKLEGAVFKLPEPSELPAALETVHTALYLLFNEGFLSTTEEPIRGELCRDAMSLTKLLVDEPTVSSSDTVGLMALMCFNAARLSSRIDEAGQLVPLDRQDRTLWDRELMTQGYLHLQRTGSMEQVVGSRYHFEAAIASRHCSASTFEDTDWDSICNLYDRLLEVAPSPLVELNRAVAISYRDGPDPAVAIVEELRQRGALPHSHVISAVLANLYTRAGSSEPAHHYLAEALSTARTEHERYLIELQFGRATSGG